LPLCVAKLAYGATVLLTSSNEAEIKEDMDFPMSWIRRHGKGRVFYTGLGHGADVFTNAQMLQHILAGIQYALGDLVADDAPDGTRKR
jgi:type 1 glutamine amidotransferase